MNNVKKKGKDKLIDILELKFNIRFTRSGGDARLMELINFFTPVAYLAIDSWHPKRVSNKCFLYLRNWKTIFIAPNPELKKTYTSLKTKDIFINTGIGSSLTTMEYFMVIESTMNTFSIDYIRMKNSGNLFLISN
jgi:hypothetical protein